MQELHTAANFALRVTKVKVRAHSQTMSTLIQEFHLWLNLAELPHLARWPLWQHRPEADGGHQAHLAPSLLVTEGIHLQFLHLLWRGQKQHPCCHIDPPAGSSP